MTVTAIDQSLETRHIIQAVNSQMSAFPLRRNPQDMTDGLQRFLKPLQLSISDCMVTSTNLNDCTYSCGLTITDSI